MNGIVLFLDLDDVLCLNKPYGGYDVLEHLQEVRAGHRTETDLQPVWNQLFDDGAKAHLVKIHGEFAPHYVMSTSWSRFCDRPLLETILCSTGLSFVADNLHQDWETQKAPGQTRAEQVRSWLDRHPEFDRRWVVVDDDASGSGLSSGWFATDGPFVVLCEEGIGLNADKSHQLRQAFRARLTGDPTVLHHAVGSHHTSGGLAEHCSVILVTPKPSLGLHKGAKGAVVHVHTDGRAYEVEFFDEVGKSKGVQTVDACDLQAIDPKAT